MKTWSTILALCCLALAGCGGGGKATPPPGSTASAQQFQYGAPTTSYTPYGTTEAIDAALAYESSPTASNAMASTSLMDAADSLLDARYGYAPSYKEGDATAQKLVADGRRAAFAAALEAGTSGLPANCTTQTANSITFSNCIYEGSGYDGSMTLDGQITTAPGALQWDLRLVIRYAGVQGSMETDYHDAGTLAVTATTAVAHQGLDFTMVVVAGGQSVRLAMEQSADLDVTHAASCASDVTGGTFEVKRVWTSAPQELGGPTYFRNGAAKVTWTGCGQAQVAYSVSR